MNDAPLLAWPGWSTYLQQKLLSVLFWTVFVVFYGGASRMAGTFGRFYTVHAAWELHIPFVPQCAPLYLSINLLLSLAPFIFRSYLELWPLALTFCTMIVIASMCFVLFPIKPGFDRPPVEGFWFNFADIVNLDHNHAPSLHVGLSFAAATAYGARCRWAGRLLFHAWAWAIAASTLLLHEHHVLDIVTGWFLAAAAIRWIYPNFRAQRKVSVECVRDENKTLSTVRATSGHQKGYRCTAN